MGSHLQLIVPEYEATGSGGKACLSYIRLGQAEKQATGEAGDAHARGDSLLTGLRFKDDWRSPVYPGKPYVYDTESGSPATDRVGLSERLLTRGGWREHTDGNRISTTRGDCVEVVDGNYKLIVLGRVANDWDGKGLGDAGNSVRNVNVGRTRQEVSSGGHYNESTSTPGEVMSITWDEDVEDGTWKTIEQTDHGDCKEVFKGYKQEHFFGPSITSTIGVATEAASIEDGFDEKGTKSSAAAHAGPPWLPAGAEITAITYARSKQTQEHIGTVDESTWTWGAHRETTNIQESSHTRALWKTTASNSVCMFFVENLVASTHDEVDAFSDWRRNYTIGGVSLGIDGALFKWKKIKGVKVGLSVLAYKLGLECGATSVACDIASKTEIKLGGLINETSGHGASLDLKTVVMECKGQELGALVCESTAKVGAFAMSGVHTLLAALNLE